MLCGGKYMSLSASLSRTKCSDGTYRDMTDQQEQHLARIKAEFAAAVDAKYRQGVREHGGNLWELKPRKLVIEAMAECVDQYTYLATLLDKM